LSRARQHDGLSRRRAAALVGITKAELAAVETGCAPVAASTLDQLVALYGVRIEALQPRGTAEVSPVAVPPTPAPRAWDAHIDFRQPVLAGAQNV
jgi:hypothetical protein